MSFQVISKSTTLDYFERSYCTTMHKWCVFRS